MTTQSAQALLTRRLADTELAQRNASDPTASAWVSANAGAGKTHVLKMRVLRLLLAGTAPSRILCLTYTKAAAAEMAARVFADLAQWATAKDDRLAQILTGLLGRAPDAGEQARSRQLFALAVETPGGLKVQTIHAFCEKLLQRFPLEARVAPGFKILDDELSAEIRREAINDALTVAVRDPASRIGSALRHIASRTQGEGFDDLVRAALADRRWLEQAAAIGDPLDRPRDDAALESAYRVALGARPAIDVGTLEAEMTTVLSSDELLRFAAVLQQGGKTDAALADGLAAAARATSTDAQIAALCSVFLTSAGEPRADSRFITKKIRAADPAMTDRMIAARDRFARLTDERLALAVAEASTALAIIADEIMQRYQAGKAARAALDFEDLVLKAANLLNGAEQASWVLYKLDGGLDHILVDEAQDTSAEQWRVVRALADEFFAGDGAADVARTIFAVGDEKQSIYSFQGAAPEMFRQTGASFRAAAERAQRALLTIPLELSFRTVAPLLAAIDQVFAEPARTPGVAGASSDGVRHHARRIGHAGLIEIWPCERPQEFTESNPFAPLDETVPASPVTTLAARIADTIAGWLASAARLDSSGQPIRPGDIIILLRKRQPFGPAMVAALKQRGVPVAGADRIHLTAQIAVCDLMALGDFLVLPEDDLALAIVLKSPLFGLDDDDLLALAPGRTGALWAALLAAATTVPRFAEAAARLKRWRARADFVPPYEFFAWLLDTEGMRARLLARLGPDAADALDEFINLALGYDDAAPPSLQGFLAWLRASRREIKRDLEHGRDQVRVMTVHGAKGLEAPIVFLPDTCSAPTGGRVSPVVQLGDTESPTGRAWAIKGASRLAIVGEAREAERQRATEEHQRLLYVAMTRARDRLYITGFEGMRGRGKDCWYDLITTSLADDFERFTLPDGREGWQRSSTQTAAPEPPTADAVTDRAPPAPLPDWALRPAPRETGVAVPLAPSRLAPLDTDDEGEPVEHTVEPAGEAPREPAASSPRVIASSNRFLRGALTHALLEHLPAIEPAEQATAALHLLGVRGQELPASVRAAIARETLAVLNHADFGAVFGPGSRAEVSVAAEIAQPSGRGQPLRVTGQIDRLIVGADAILIVDFKTNRPPPEELDDVPRAYILQLAAYRLAISHAFAGKLVRAALLWTDGARLMELHADLLDQGERELWALAGARLDG